MAAGSLTGVDQWAVRHAPDEHVAASSPTLLHSIVPLLGADFRTPFLAIAELVTLPGQVVVSGLLVASACVVLGRRRRIAAAAAWATAWLLASAIEVVCKGLLERPPLYLRGRHLVAFDSSWPSGHAVRVAVVAAAWGAAWPALRPLLVLWVAVAVALLVPAGFHTPSDVVGGILLAVLLAAAATAVERSGALRRGAAAARAARARPGAAAGRR